MSLKKFKSIDILVFCVIAIIFELLNHFASTYFDDFKIVFLSYSIVLSLICIYRWGLIGSVVAFVGGIAACAVAYSNDLSQYVAYGLGNLFVMIPALIFQYGIGRERLKKYKVLQIVYLIVDFAFVILFRCLILSFFYMDTYFETLVQNLKYECVLESMSLVISCFILLISSRKNGLFVEMVGYILDVKDKAKLGHLKEYHENKNFNFDKPFTEEGQIDDGNLIDGGTLTKKQLDELDEMYQEGVAFSKTGEKNEKPN